MASKKMGHFGMVGWYHLSRRWTCLGLIMCLVPPPITVIMILLEQHSLQNEGHAEMPSLPVSTLSLCLCHGKSVIVMLLPLISLLLLNGWWLDGFLSHFKHFFVWSRSRWFSWRWARNKWLYASLRHTDAVRPWMKVEVEKSCRKADLFKQKWNGPVSYTHLTLPTRRWV